MRQANSKVSYGYEYIPKLNSFTLSELNQKLVHYDPPKNLKMSQNKLELSWAKLSQHWGQLLH